MRVTEKAAATAMMAVAKVATMAVERVVALMVVAKLAAMEVDDVVEVMVAERVGLMEGGIVEVEPSAAAAKAKG